MKKLLLFLALFLFPTSLCYGADFYVSSDGTGDGSSKSSPYPYASLSSKWGDFLAADQTIYLLGGTYTDLLAIDHNSNYRLTIKPCSASPDPSGCDGLVTLSPANSGTPASPGTVLTINHKNVTINGKKSAASSDRNIKIIPGNRHGVEVVGDLGNKIQYIELTGMLDGNADAENSCMGLVSPYCVIKGINAGFNGTGTEIEHNYLHDNIGSADIQAGGSSNTDYGLVKVHDNIITAGTVNFIAGHLHSTDVFNNVFTATGASVLYDIIHAFETNLKYIRIYSNEFINGDESGVQQLFLEQGNDIGGTTSNIRIYNNTFMRTGTGAADLGIMIYSKQNNSLDNIYIVNNSFIGKMYPIRMVSATGTTSEYTNSKIENNIFYDTVHHIAVADNGGSLEWATDSAFTNDHNIYNHPTANIFSWMASDLTTPKDYTTVCSETCTWTTDHPTFTYNIDADPLYTSATDLTLQLGSPAINAGKDLSAYTGFDASWPTDKLGVSRPTGLWDIGAYEYVETITTTPGVSGGTSRGSTHQ
jgi:hypothetical protein